MTETMTTKQFNEKHAPARRKSKYGNKKTVVDGISFQSKKEARRYKELQVLQAAGRISQLNRQTKFVAFINGQRVCSYSADFTYFENGKLIVEDVKSEATRKNAYYRMKKRVIEAYHGFEILET